MAGFEELSLIAIVPRGTGECMEYQISADPNDSGEKLKKRIEKICGVPPDDMELFLKNQDVQDAKQKWLNEEGTLKEQEVRDGAIITVGIHGLKGNMDIDVENAEIPDDHVQRSIYAKGESSYYFAHARKGDLDDEQRIVSGGPPAKLMETEAMKGDARVPLSKLMDEEDDTPARPMRPIRNYSWGDEKENIKIYISEDNEQDVLKAAGDGKQGQVDVKFGPKYVRVRVHGPLHDFQLEMDRIYYEIIPEQSKWRVSQNKRITLTLKKKEIMTWLKLLKPES